MKRYIQLFLLLIFVPMVGLAAEQQWEWKFYYGNGIHMSKVLCYDDANNTYEYQKVTPEKLSLWQLGAEWNYRINSIFSTGCYFAFGKTQVFRYSSEAQIIATSTTKNGCAFGVQGICHLVAIWRQQPCRFDVYTKVSIGDKAMRKTYSSSHKFSHFLEAGAGLGCAVYLTKRIGLFGDFSLGHYYHTWYNWRTGITLRY